ncbi:MAG: thiol-activated cytolysin family protein [Lachnospiraceae bacterium]|nr:thiol-activated cytolysin family protein [Lachnospiraceae bacterium]
MKNLKGEKTMGDINNTNDAERNQDPIPGNGQPEISQPEQKSPEQELQEIYREQQQFEQQEKQSQALLTDLKKKQKQLNKKHRKLRRSRHWARFVCLIVLAVLAAESIRIYLMQEARHAASQQETEQEYTTEYWQWKTNAFKSYYDSQINERQQAAGRLNASDHAGMNAYIASLDRVVKGLRTETAGLITCFTDTQTYDLNGYTIAGGGNAVIFPGAVLKGDSLFQGTADYTLLPLERTAIHLTSSQAGGTSAKIEDASYRGVMDFLDSCAGKNEGQAAREWNYYMQTYRNSTELKASLGVELPGTGGFELGSTNHTEVSSVAVIYRQVYYTVNAEPQKSAAEYFRDGADPAAFGDYEPAYVSSVDYGRMVVVLVQGNMSAEELGAKVSGCIKGVDISAGLNSILEESDIEYRLFQYGGEQKDAGMITDSSQKTLGIVGQWEEFLHGSEDKADLQTRVNDFIRTDAPTTNPVPIGYTLKYLTDNSFVPAMMVTGRKTMLAEEDAVRRVKITTDLWVDWDEAAMANTSIYVTEKDDAYEYEFLWDSDGLGMLQGQVSITYDSWLGSSTFTGEARLNLKGLSYGTNNITMDIDVGDGIVPVKVNVVISDY